ncbi:MAG: hypothetical protein LBQ54_07975 [Planctomycetaceae bacterium]|jgi:hypothetical protein|nr:hypothetical protein [Planctomycetaceae bacterium]
MKRHALLAVLTATVVLAVSTTIAQAGPFGRIAFFVKCNPCAPAACAPCEPVACAPCEPAAAPCEPACGETCTPKFRRPQLLAKLHGLFAQLHTHTPCEPAVCEPAACTPCEPVVAPPCEPACDDTCDADCGPKFHRPQLLGKLRGLLAHVHFHSCSYTVPAACTTPCEPAAPPCEPACEVCTPACAK